MHPSSQTSSCLSVVFGFEYLSQGLDLVNRASHASPVNVLQLPVALSIYSEARIVLSLDQPVPPLVIVDTPRLNGKWLVLVIFLAGLLIGFLDCPADVVGRGQGPHDECLEEVKLQRRGQLGHVMYTGKKCWWVLPSQRGRGR